MSATCHFPFLLACSVTSVPCLLLDFTILQCTMCLLSVTGDEVTNSPCLPCYPFCYLSPTFISSFNPLPPPSINPYLTLSPFNSNVHDLVRRDSCYSFLLCGGVVVQEFLFALLCINKENAPSFPRINSHQKRTQLTTKKVFFLDA